MTKEDNEDFKDSAKLWTVTMITLIMILKQEIIVISLENIQTLLIKVVI